MARTGRPKKEPSRVYSRMLRVRVRPEDDQLIREAARLVAERKGTGDVSSWLREVVVSAARREVAKNGGRE